jgi:type I restriction enzyme R subunit
MARSQSCRYADFAPSPEKFVVTTPEAIARQTIDAALIAAGWAVQDVAAINLFASRGVAVREFPLPGHGEADYLLFVDRQAVGAVEAKKEGETLTGVEIQTARYAEGLPATMTAPMRPLPFLYESTGIETQFTNRLDPEPRSRRVFAFHRPEALAGWLDDLQRLGPERATLRGRLLQMPPLHETGLWPAQIAAVQRLERSLAQNRTRSLIQMATGSGKTFTAISAIYRLIKFGGARRVLFLVDRANLGRQTLKEFQTFVTPDDGRKFTELYNVQHLTSNRIDPVNRVCILTIQRLYAMLRGDDDLDPAAEEESFFARPRDREPPPVVYNPEIPIELFDVIFTDECHRSIYNLWRQTLEYFDAFLIGLTATPSKQTIGFFDQNLVMEYGHEQAVIDGVNVGFDVYRIQTAITAGGSTVEADFWVDKRDRLTRKVRWEQLDEDLTYGAKDLDRTVVAVDQIRTVIQTFRDRLGEIFPGRTEVPKTLIFAKDDSHADDIVRIVREEFGRGNDFCQKITYRTTGAKPEDLLAAFRNSYNPRIVVTVDMIATGTDIKPLEIVMFMRSVKSRNFFEQMKGRGVRVIDPTDLKAVTPDATSKDHFVLIDCVGVTEENLSDSQPLERRYSASFASLLREVSFGIVDADALSSLANRLTRLDRQIGEADRKAIAEASGGLTLQEIAGGIVAALDPDAHVSAARAEHGLPPDATPSAEQIAAAKQRLLVEAAKPLAANPALRETLLETKQRFEQIIDKISEDRLLYAGHSRDAAERARATVTSFQRYIEEHRDEITALQVLYSRPYARRLRLKEIRALADAIAAPPRNWTPEGLWRAYETLDAGKVRGSGTRVLTDIVALVRYAIGQEAELVPYPEQVNARFAAWLARQAVNGRAFTPEQRAWLEAMRDHIAASLRIEPDDFEYAPFAQRGGIGKVYEVFGPEWPQLLEELNEVLAA